VQPLTPTGNTTPPPSNLNHAERKRLTELAAWLALRSDRGRALASLIERVVNLAHESAALRGVLAQERERLAQALATIARLEARIAELERQPPEQAPPEGWHLSYRPGQRTPWIRRPDGIQIGVEVYPDFWPKELLV
jgi:hypothetical protein